MQRQTTSISQLSPAFPAQPSGVSWLPKSIPPCSRPGHSGAFGPLVAAVAICHDPAPAPGNSLPRRVHAKDQRFTWFYICSNHHSLSTQKGTNSSLPLPTKTNGILQTPQALKGDFPSMPSFADAVGSDEGFRRARLVQGRARVPPLSRPTCTCQAPNAAPDLLAATKELETSPKTSWCPTAPWSGRGAARGAAPCKSLSIG